MTHNPYQSYQTSTDHVQEGIWVEELREGLRVRVRFAGEENRKYWAEFMKKMAPFQPTLKKLDKTPEIAAIFDKKTITPALAQLFVDHIIIDWQVSDGIDEKTGDFIWKPGMLNMQGELVDFDPELVKQIILAVPRLFARIREVAGDYSLFSGGVVMADEDTVKNSAEL